MGCAATDGLERFVALCSTRGAPGGETPLDALGLMPSLQSLYAPVAKAAGLPKRALSFRSPAGRCPTCGGSGRERIALDVLADLQLPCPTCEGRRYRPEVLALRWQGMDPAELLARPVASLELPGKLAAATQALTRVGLGHLALGRRRSELSGGEAQRLGLAAALAGSASPALHLLDEPATGLHEADLQGLVEVLHELADRGDLVVAAAHRLSLITAADHVLDLGPGSGPDGGRVVTQGPPADLQEGATARALRTLPSA